MSESASTGPRAEQLTEGAVTELLIDLECSISHEVFRYALQFGCRGSVDA